jgi:Iron-containing redox enzyme
MFEPARTADRPSSAITLEQFWETAALAKLEARFAVAREMEVLPHLSIDALRQVMLQYRYFTQTFATDIALLVARCPESRLRSLLGELLDEELGHGDPELSHLRLYDRFLETIGCIEPGATSATLASRVHPQVRELLVDLSARTVDRSPHYAIGLRGVGGECVCGVYFSVMHGHLRTHPYVVENEASIDWRFWDIHAGHADVEHAQKVRAAVVELLGDQPEGVAELARGFADGTAAWEEFWRIVYQEHIAVDGGGRARA